MGLNNISIFLDVALSLTFFYFITSMFVSGIVEFIHTILEKRAAFLQKSLEKISISAKDNLWNKLKDNPFITNLEDEVDKRWKLWGRKMSYLDSNTFVSAVIHELSKIHIDEDETIKNDFDKIKKQIESFGDGTFQEILKTLIRESTNIKIFEEKLAKWFEQYMEHVTGWFKRYARLTVMLTSVVVTIALNLNTVVITKQLASDKDLRDSFVNKAVTLAQKDKIDIQSDSQFNEFLKDKYSNLYAKLKDTSKSLTGVDSLTYSEAVVKYYEKNLQSLGLNIGYNFHHKSCWDNICEMFQQNNTTPLQTIIGWILTVSALSFGAPFWFDLLVKLVNVRNVMKKPNSN